MDKLHFLLESGANPQTALIYLCEPGRLRALEDCFGINNVGNMIKELVVYGGEIKNLPQEKDLLFYSKRADNPRYFSME